MAIIIGLIGLWAFFGIGGVLVGIIASLFKSETFRNSVGNIADEIFSDESNQQSIDKQNKSKTHENRLTMQDVTPFIDLLCYFALKYEKNWNRDKINFIKEIFIDIADNNDDEIVYLRERMKLRNRPDFEDIMYTVNHIFQSENREFRQLILDKVIVLLINTCDDVNLVRSDAITFAKRAGMPYSEYINIINDYTENNGQQSSNQTSQQSEREFHAEVLGVSPNASEEEIKSAYRRKIKEFHPDRNVNVTSTVEALIRQETQKLNLAKDYLLKNR